MPGIASGMYGSLKAKTTLFGGLARLKDTLVKSKKVFRDIVLLCIVKPFKVLTTIRYYFSMLPRNFAIARYQTLFPT